MKTKVLFLFLLLCSTTGHARAVELVDEEERSQAIQNAKVFVHDVEWIGSEESQAPRFAALSPSDSSIECDYKPHKRGGTTPKFSCEVTKAFDSHGQEIPTHHEKIKVRYKGVKVFSMTIATQLAWALGFAADIETPVARITCRGCGTDPYSHSAVYDGATDFENVSVEQPMPGMPMAVEGRKFFRDGGEDSPSWYWNELPHTADYDALKLFAVLLKDNDSKAVQNTLVCQSELVEGHCPNPLLAIHDFGHVLGGDGLFIHPLKLKKWSRERIWKSSNSCETKLTEVWFNGSGLVNPEISEEGRVVLATRLNALLSPPEVIRKIFDSAHISDYYDHGAYYGSDEWVEAFKEKAQEIIGHSCAEDPQDP